jgi:hypothetical protein
MAYTHGSMPMPTYTMLMPSLLQYMGYAQAYAHCLCLCPVPMPTYAYAYLCLAYAPAYMSCHNECLSQAPYIGLSQALI